MTRVITINADMLGFLRQPNLRDYNEC
jgi:hypothetical protein